MENDCGILAGGFRVFHTNISLKLDNNIVDIVMCYCVLHNFLHTCLEGYITPQDLEEANTKSPLLHLKREQPKCISRAQKCL